MSERDRGPSLRAAVVVAVITALGWPVLGAAAVRARAATSAAPAPAHHRLRVGLVLSGGGARGAAHIGVLKVLARMHIPIDAIAGTSMGAVVGGLYASGMSPSQIESVMESVNWNAAFNTEPPRKDLSFRRKEERRKFPVRLPLGLRGGRLRLPRGLIESENLTRILRRLTLPVAGITSFNDLPTPFRAVATDLTTGKAVVMANGDLVTAMRASMAAPGVFSPVERDGRLLVDGGISENVPIDVARMMHVDVLIVVNVGFPLYPRSKLVSPAAISNQMLAILMRRESERQLATLTSRDILITPQLGNASTFNFSIIKRAITLGEQAALAAGPRLRALEVSPKAYARYVARREARRRPLPKIEFVHVARGSKHYSAAVHAVFDNLIGRRLSPKAVDNRVTDLYGRGDLALLDYQVVSRSGETGLEVRARRHSYGPNYVRFGLDLEDDFQGNAFYNADALLVMSDLTSTGAEWVLNLQEGISPHAYSEFYLPLSNYWTYFLLPHAEYSATNVPLIGSGERQIADFRLRDFNYGLDFGRELGNWGEARVGFLHDEGKSYVRIGSPSLPKTDFRDYGFFVRFSYDQLDDVAFPHSGELARVQWDSLTNRVSLAGAGTSSSPLNQVTLNWLAAKTFGRETAILWATGGETLDQTTPLDLHTQFTLGGLFNLSGLPAQSLAGADFGIARLLVYRKISSGGEGPLHFPAYAGFSFEAGNVWSRRSAIALNSVRKDGSIFLGLDTPIGPVYLATGLDQGGSEAFYLTLGRSF